LELVNLLERHGQNIAALIRERKESIRATEAVLEKIQRMKLV
jgi:hypothetical protein